MGSFVWTGTNLDGTTAAGGALGEPNVMTGNTESSGFAWVAMFTTANSFGASRPLYGDVPTRDHTGCRRSPGATHPGLDGHRPGDVSRGTEAPWSGRRVTAPPFRTAQDSAVCSTARCPLPPRVASVARSSRAGRDHPVAPTLARKAECCVRRTCQLSAPPRSTRCG